MPFPKKKNKRINSLAVVMAAVVAVCSARMFFLQIVNANHYLAQASGVTARTAALKAPRGEILDCYSRKIATNREGYNIVFNSAYINWDTLNGMILDLCEYLESEDAEWNDVLPLEKQAPYGFTKENNDTFLASIGLAHYATAENAFDKLKQLYNIKDCTENEARIIMGVRYSMAQAAFSIANPYTFAEDVSSGIMQRISENGFILDGVTVDTVPFREYSSDAPVHIIGNVGPIYAEEWYGDKEKGITGLKDKGYTYSDKVGKSGIEAYCEEKLRGTDGEITYYLDSDGTVLSSEITKEPIPGKTVVLTIDKNIQQKTQAALSEAVYKNNSEGGACTGGAAVVMDIKNGAILSSSNYPTFDMATYFSNYESIANAPNNPLINRAFQGVYPVGSTIKPLVAIAGIDNGLITADENVRCVHTYRLFSDYQPSCMGTHGNISLTRALARSCNYYFFEVGRRVGATKLCDYYNKFGLGVKTGVEVGDSKGIFANVEEGSGDTLQIAIGQKNAFTPLQLAVYTSTLANGGTRYKATLIKDIVSYDLKNTYITGQTEVLETVELSEYALDSVKKGMLSVTEDGTGSLVFSTYPIKVGGKTGTAQNEGVDHSVFVAFAPFENPEIAIAVVLEHGKSGAQTVAKAALDAYFFSDEASVDNFVSYTPLE